MKAKLSPKESFVLYGVVLGFVFLFYLLGLFIGKSHFVEAKPNGENLSVSREPVRDLQPQLDFYQRLMVPSGSEKETPVEESSGSLAQMENKGSGLDEESRKAFLGIYTVQVGAFTAEADARQIFIRLEAKGYSGSVRPPWGEDRYYRVGVGEFKTEEEAGRMEALLRKDRFLTYIRKIEVASPAN
ncbi:SPOR domain-containing protein [Acidobacteria bacterium AH-259-A15]|nr:SPOR domain-containing protein [Acidobacteria bacterium AH-259-A15]